MFKSNEDKLADAKKTKAEATKMNAEAFLQRAGAKFRAQEAKAEAAKAQSEAEMAQHEAEMAKANAEIAKAGAEYAKIKEQKNARLQELAGTAELLVATLREFDIPPTASQALVSYPLPTDRDEFVKVFPILVGEAERTFAFFHKMIQSSSFTNHESNWIGCWRVKPWTYLTAGPESLKIGSRLTGKIRIQDSRDFYDPSDLSKEIRNISVAFDKIVVYLDAVKQKLFEWQLKCDFVCPQDEQAIKLKNSLDADLFPHIEAQKQSIQEAKAKLVPLLAKIEELEEEHKKENKQRHEDLKRRTEEIYGREGERKTITSAIDAMSNEEKITLLRKIFKFFLLFLAGWIIFGLLGMFFLKIFFS